MKSTTGEGNTFPSSECNTSLSFSFGVEFRSSATCVRMCVEEMKNSGGTDTVPAVVIWRTTMTLSFPSTVVPTGGLSESESFFSDFRREFHEPDLSTTLTDTLLSSVFL